MTTTICGVELEFDMLDAAQNATFCAQLESLIVTLQKDYAGQAAAQVIEAQCHAIFGFFNSVFGEETDRLLFGERCNLRVAMEALANICLAAERQQRESLYQTSLLRRYTPERARGPVRRLIFHDGKDDSGDGISGGGQWPTTGSAKEAQNPFLQNYDSDSRIMP